MTMLQVILILIGVTILPFAIIFAAENLQIMKILCGFLLGASLCTTIILTWFWCERLEIIYFKQAMLLITSGIVIASSFLGCIYYGSDR